MKKCMLFSFALIMTAIVFTACEKEEQIATDDPNMEIVDAVAEFFEDDLAIEEEVDEIGATGRVALGPDLVVTGVGSNLFNTGLCPVQIGAPQLPNAGCGGTLGGSTSFTVLARVKNIGNGNIPAGSFVVSWALSGFGIQGLTTVNHGGIPAGSAIALSRNWTLPCPTAFPIGLTERSFRVTADINNVVSERNETNNASRPYVICDDI